MPGGVGIPADGGYRVKGAWDYASGCDLATHFFGSTMVHDPQTKAPLGNAWILFDHDQFKIVDNWDVIGMQGTGSRRVVIDDAFVNADRALWFLDGQGRPGSRSARPRTASQSDVPSRLACSSPYF